MLPLAPPPPFPSFPLPPPLPWPDSQAAQVDESTFESGAPMGGMGVADGAWGWGGGGMDDGTGFLSELDLAH